MIQDQISRGIVEEVPVVQDNPVAVLHYLPHHHVVRQDKTTTKVRVAYDASARVRSHPSVNDCLHTGPPLLEQITDILLWFRSHAVAFTADIQRAFLMIGIHDSDRDALRFLALRILSPTLLRSRGIASPELCSLYDQAHSCLIQVLSASAKLYDLLGFMAPVSIALKVFHQQLCKVKIGWVTRWREISLRNGNRLSRPCMRRR